MEIFFDDVARTDDEVEIADLDNLLLATLVAFALSIRECRRDPAAIRQKLLDYICSITPATWAAILPPPESDIHFDPIGQTNGVDVPQALRVKSSIVRHVSETGVPIMSSAVLCVTMRAFHSVQGIIYAEASPDEPFNRLHLELVMGVAAAGAIGIEHAATVQILEIENSLLKEDLDIRTDMIGNSMALTVVKELIAVTAGTDSTVLIQGETGTGKELVARAIHNNSKRAGRPFVAVNCGALAEGTAESELFGHEKGSFTGAIAQKRGKFEVADTGTLFLDEVGELPPALQVKLLRVLQEQEFERVGGTRPIKVNVRMIGATNRNLDTMAAEGKFRQDLLYRLNVMPVSTPALRDRREDIPILAQHFISRYTAEMGRSMSSISAGAARKLQEYDWPGNIRELQNVIQRAIIVAGSNRMLLPEHLPNLAPAGMRAPQTDRLTLDERHTQERERLQTLLVQTAGDCKEISRLIGQSVPTIYRRVREFRLSHLLQRPRR